MLRLIAGCDKEKSPDSSSLQQMHDKDTEGETKSRLSAVAYFTLHGEVIWVQTHRTKACPAALSFLGIRWVSSASLETGIQVDLIMNRPLF